MKHKKILIKTQNQTMWNSLTKVIAMTTLNQVSIEIPFWTIDVQIEIKDENLRRINILRFCHYKYQNQLN